MCDLEFPEVVLLPSVFVLDLNSRLHCLNNGTYFGPNCVHLHLRRSVRFNDFLYYCVSNFYLFIFFLYSDYFYTTFIARKVVVMYDSDFTIY